MTKPPPSHSAKTSELVATYAEELAKVRIRIEQHPSWPTLVKLYERINEYRRQQFGDAQGPITDPIHMLSHAEDSLPDYEWKTLESREERRGKWGIWETKVLTLTQVHLGMRHVFKIKAALLIPSSEFISIFTLIESELSRDF